MSKVDQQKIKCPSCGKESKFEIWDSVNVSVDPDIKEKVLNGDLFKFKCPKCHEETYVHYPCLYHDMEEKFMIYYLPNEQTEDEINKDTEILNKYSKVYDGYKFRIVRDPNRLIEKVAVFDDLKDDMITEALKTVVAHNLSPEEIDKVRGLYYQGTDEEGIVYALIFDDEQKGCVVPIEAYNEIKENNKFTYPDKFAEITEFTYQNYLK